MLNNEVAINEPAQEARYFACEMKYVDRWIIGISAFCLLAVTFEFLALRLYVPLWGSIAAVLTALGVGRTFYGKLTAIAPSPTDSKVYWPCICVVAAFATLLVSTYYKGYVLPAHDPIAVPLLSKVIASGKLPVDVFVPGSSAYSYPPGYPIIFAPLMALLPTPEVYFVFKLINLLTIALIPVTWTWMQRRLFPVALPSWIMLVAAYLVFFGIERTVGFAIPFAGKNAVLLGVMIAPIVIVTMVDGCSSFGKSIVSGIVFTGLVLIHYSMLHMLTCIIGAYVILYLSKGRLSWRKVANLALAGSVPVFFMLVFFNEALADPRSGKFVFLPFQGLKDLFSIILAKNSFIVIYSDIKSDMIGFPYRGVSLCLSVSISLLLAKAGKAPVGLTDGTWIFFIAFIGSLSMVVGLLPSGLTGDFARWYIWAIQAMVFLQTCLCALWLSNVSSGRTKWLAISSIGLIALFALTIIQMDAYVYREVNQREVVTKRELREMQRILSSSDVGDECLIISESTQIPSLLVTIQSVKAWEYAESASSCRYANGSWMQPGVLGGRELSGFPSADVIKRIAPQTALFFLGSENRLNFYTGLLKEAGISVSWTKVGATRGISVWQRK